MKTTATNLERPGDSSGQRSQLICVVACWLDMGLSMCFDRRMLLNTVGHSFLTCLSARLGLFKGKYVGLIIPQMKLLRIWLSGPIWRSNAPTSFGSPTDGTWDTHFPPVTLTVPNLFVILALILTVLELSHSFQIVSSVLAKVGCVRTCEVRIRSLKLGVCNALLSDPVTHVSKRQSESAFVANLQDHIWYSNSVVIKSKLLR